MSEGLQDIEEITTPTVPADRTHAYHLYPVLYDGSEYGATRDEFVSFLYHEFGIKTVPHYLPPYRFSIFQEMGYEWSQCPVAIYLAKT